MAKTRKKTRPAVRKAQPTKKAATKKAVGKKPAAKKALAKKAVPKKVAPGRQAVAQTKRTPRRPEPPGDGRFYVIRRVSFMYTDEYFAPIHRSGIEGVYTSEARAKEKLMAWEADRLREVDLGQVQETCGYSGRAVAERDRLHEYLIANFGESCFAGTPGNRRVEHGKCLPEDATDEQIMEIREIIGVRFHELSVFEQEPVFFRIWDPQTGKYDGYAETGFTYFYDSFEEARAAAADRRIGRLSHTELPLESMSDQPGLVRTLLESRSTKQWTRDEAIAVNALLRTPLWEIRPLPLEDAEDLEEEGLGGPPSAEYGDFD